MNRVWNPFAFNMMGRPAAVMAPPALRVAGKATKEQIAAAQAVFYRFCDAARTSFVPNPTQSGRLPDGSAYRITQVGPQAIMQLWPAVTDSTGPIFSGLLFPRGEGTDRKFSILVNEGSVDAPGTEWKVVEPPYPIDFGGRVDPVSYNLYAWVEVARILPGEARYVYDFFGMSQYARTIAYGNPNNVKIIGVTEQGKITAFAKINNTIHTYESRKNISDIPFNGISDLPEPLPLIDFVDRGSIHPASDDSSIHHVTASRSGRQIFFVADEAVYATPVDLPADRMIESTTTHSLSVDVEASETGGVYIYTKTRRINSEGEYVVKDVRVRVMKSTIGRNGFSTADTFLELPKQHIDPPMFVRGVATSGNRVKIQNPGPTAVRITDFVWADRAKDGGGAGPIGYTATRDEKTSYVYSLYHVGTETLVCLVAHNELHYRQTLQGSWYTWDRGHAGAHGSTWPTTTHTETKEHINLLDGSELVLSRTSYDGQSSNVIHDTWQGDGDGRLFSTSRGNASLSYTFSREQRDLFVYDPALDLICYSEVQFSFSWSGTASRYAESNTLPFEYHESNSSSAGPELPVGTPYYIVIKCRGVETRFAIPESYISSLPTRERLLFYGSFFPNCGVAPTAPANGGPQTTGGFSYQHIDPLSPFEERERDFISDRCIHLNGMFPKIPLPSDIMVLYRKTPETGAGFLSISSYNKEISKRYLVDLSGLREADAVVSDLPPTPWGNVSLF